jgi:hypothetical protein
MKRLLATTSLILLISAPVSAEVFFEPQWNEFCPNQYINISTTKDYFMTEKVYWSGRRKEFESRLNKCKKLVPERKEACFANLREIEKNATETHMDELNVKYIKYNYWTN